MVKHAHAKEVIEKILASVEGGQAFVAREIDVPPALVYQWTRGLRPIAAKHAIALETLTNGEVTRHDIAPDVFGPSNDSSH
jgi:DNA-binding transcriptional regulator YdaS (Cro superfamily)